MNKVGPIKDKNKIDDMKNYLKNKNKRDYLLFLIGISCSLTISEIIKLKVCDIWTGKCPQTIIIARDKRSNKQKEFPVGKNLKEAIIEFMNEHNLSMYDYVFQSRKGSNCYITRQRAATIISDAAKSVGIKEPISPHSMRKTWGYWAYKRGMSLVLIKEALNQSSISITREYLSITDADSKQAYIDLDL